jgi:hypothetical protein
MDYSDNNMARSIQIYLPPDWAEGMKQAWNFLADEIISDDEAGQRGAKASMLFQMFCSAMMTNATETIERVKDVKRLTQPAPDAGDSAASSELVQASALSTSQTLSSPQRG